MRLWHLGREHYNTFPSIFSPQDVDMVVAGMTITSERETVVDFTYLYWEDKIGMLTGTLPDDPYYMFKPLHIYVWVSFAASALVAAIGATCYETWSVRIGVTSTKGFLLPLYPLWYTVSALWLQGNFSFYCHTCMHGNISKDSGLYNSDKY